MATLDPVTLPCTYVYSSFTRILLYSIIPH